MTVRIGLLAASRIARHAIVEPALEVDGVEVTAVAARDLGRARDAAEQWGLEHAYGSYDDLIASDHVDAIYIGTPAALHREWTVKSIAAGKHVLCEKPLAANADDARRVADATEQGDVVVMEAFHWRYHPYTDQIRAVLDSGVLGRPNRIEARFDIPDGRLRDDDIRWNLAIGGGSTMDLGCYAIQWVRFAANADPEVVSAEAVCPVDGVDGALDAELRWASGVTGSIGSSMIADIESVSAYLEVSGENGTLTVSNLAPQHGAAIFTVDTVHGCETYTADPSTTYFHQLVAFRNAIVDGAAFPTTAADGVRNQEIVDACYRAAGLAPRPTWAT